MNLVKTNRAHLINNYILFLQHNINNLIENKQDACFIDLADYLVEELNYTREDAEKIKKEIKAICNEKEKDE